jgi:hypothetical protein
MRDGIPSQGERQRTCDRVTARAFHRSWRHWFLLLCGVVLVTAWPAQAQAPNANELASVFETALRAKDFDAVSKHVSAQPTTVKAFMRVLEARLGKFRNLQSLRVYAVPAGGKVAEDKAVLDFQKRGARFVPLKTHLDQLKTIAGPWMVAPVGYLVVLDDTEIFTVIYGDSGGRSVITYPEPR